MTGLSYLPFRFTATPAARERLKGGLREAASAAAQAIVAQRKGLEVHFLQVKTQGELLAICSRVSKRGILEIEIDLGDAKWPSLLLLPKRRVESASPGPDRGKRRSR